MNPILVSALLLCPTAVPPQGDEAAAARTSSVEESTAEIGAKVKAMLADIRASNMQKTVEDLVGFGTRQILSTTEDETRGTGAARSYLEKKMLGFAKASGGRLTVKRETYGMPSTRLGRNVELVNIVATLKGISDPDRIYVVGGHYDSINRNPRDSEGRAPGANDDGSGTSVVVELCRVMSKHEFAATIKFVCYDGEEQGLLGSTGHAKALEKAEANVDGMITNDIVGNTLGMDGKRRRGYLRCFSYSPTGNDSTGRSLARAATYASRTHVSDFELRLVYRGDRYGRGGDHKPFYQSGYPSVRFTEPREDYSRQHQNVTERDGKPYGDLPEFMDFKYMTKVASVNTATLAELASAPPAPAAARARGARSAYDINITWTEVPSVRRYEVVWRRTTAPDWENARMIDQPRRSRGRRGGESLAYALKGVCLDDVVVGIRAVAPDGSRSRVTTPPEPDSFNLRRRRNR